ncbi:MAG TPA: GNAT family N-acetyltransferase [Mycobacteriales bacterium]
MESSEQEPVTIVRWGAADLRRRLDEAMAVYTTAMGYPAETGRSRAGFTAAHTSRSGFRCTAAIAGDVLAGFGYGYTSQTGQWWHDQVNGALDRDIAARWFVDCFELCELHVLPVWQGNGVGRELLTRLVDGIPERRVLLSTPEGRTRAWQLYRSLGFVDVLRDHFFPGDRRPFAILGADLPFAAHA